MRKLLCVNAKILKFTNPVTRQVERCNPVGLVEGEVYTTRGESYTGSNGRECYFIDGIGERLKCRFTTYLDDVTKEEVKAEQAIIDIVKELNLN